MHLNASQIPFVTMETGVCRHSTPQAHNRPTGCASMLAPWCHVRPWPCFSVRQPNGRARLNHCTDVRRRPDAVRITLTRRTGPMNHKTPVQTDKLLDPRRGQRLEPIPISVEPLPLLSKTTFTKDGSRTMSRGCSSTTSPRPTLLASQPRQSLVVSTIKPSKNGFTTLLNLQRPVRWTKRGQITRQRCRSSATSPLPNPSFQAVLSTQ